MLNDFNNHKMQNKYVNDIANPAQSDSICYQKVPLQKQPSSGRKQPFADAFRNSCSLKIHNIHRKTPVLESLLEFLLSCNTSDGCSWQVFKKIATLKSHSQITGKYLRWSLYWKKDFMVTIFMYILGNSKNSFFVKNFYDLCTLK